MRELHVVSVSDDGGHVVLAGGAEGEEFLVPLDDRLRALVQADADRKAALSPAPAAPAPSAPPAPPAVPAAPAAPRSSVTPKQIQARLRAGETVEEIAASAGMPVAKVERFAWPVVSEQERMISGTRAAVLVRPRRGPSVLPIGDAVAEHLQDLGLPADATPGQLGARSPAAGSCRSRSWRSRGRARPGGATSPRPVRCRRSIPTPRLSATPTHPSPTARARRRRAGGPVGRPELLLRDPRHPGQARPRRPGRRPRPR